MDINACNSILVHLKGLSFYLNLIWVLLLSLFIYYDYFYTQMNRIAPTAVRALQALGANLRLARMRRNMTATRMAERAGISRKTLYQMEQGHPGVAAGNYAQVLFVLELVDELGDVGVQDPVGRTLQDGRMKGGR